MLTLVLQLLLLQRLLLGGIQMLERDHIGVSAVLLHGGHHSRVHTAGVATSHRVASKLVRHATPRRAWLSTVRTHAGTHRMTRYTWVSHAGGMALKVWAHTRGHHSLSSRSAIHRQRISTNVLAAIACTCVNRKTSDATLKSG